jgi:putative nucleotidyltransferase with HDIG domain
MTATDEIRAGVRASLPELELIADADLRDRVVEAWALALAETEFARIEDIRGSGGPDTSPIGGGTQATHIRAVARVALSIAEALEEAVGDCGVDRDLLLACALCHDVGKPFEFSPRNRARWEANPTASGYPAFRHPVYGAHIALTVGLPEAVAHCAGAHSAEGENVVRGLENTVVHLADHAFWTILNRAGALTETVPAPAASSPTRR